MTSGDVHPNPEDYDYNVILEYTKKWTEDTYREFPNFPGRVIFEDHFRRYQSLRERIFRYYVRNNGGNILDVGWGGFPCCYDMLFNGNYYGIDFNPQVKSTLVKYPLVIHTEGNFEDRLCYLPQIADLAIWTEGPEHSINISAVMENIKYALKPSGVFVTSTPNNWGVSELHVRNFTEQSFRERLEQHFTVVEYALEEPWLIAVCKKS